MTRFYRAALTAAMLAASAAPALAQNAPMGAPSDTTPPAPIQASAAADTATPAQDAAAPKPARVHHIRHHHVTTHKAAVPVAAQTGS